MPLIILCHPCVVSLDTDETVPSPLCHSDVHTSCSASHRASVLEGLFASSEFVSRVMKDAIQSVEFENNMFFEDHLVNNVHLICCSLSHGRVSVC